MIGNKLNKRLLSLIITLLLVMSGSSPVAQLAAASARDDKAISSSELSGLESNEDRVYEQVMRLDRDMRDKIAPDLAPFLVEANQTSTASPVEAQAFFADQSDGSSFDKRSLRVIVQTASRPDDELLQAVSVRSMRRAALDEPSSDGAREVMAQRFESIDGFVAEMTPAEIRHLAARGDVVHISPDRTTQAMGEDCDLDEETGATNVRALFSTLTGTGIGIAFLDSGIDKTNPALKNSSGSSRVKAAVNFVTGETTTSDRNGHGTSVAGAAAGRLYQGISGIATNANLINVRVLNAKGEGLVSDAIRGLDWVIANKGTYKIRVANLSLGASSVGSFTNDPLCKAVERVVAAGIAVVTSAGNNGRDSQGREIYGSITSPGNDPLVITVGSANTRGTSYRSDDIINNFSSRGPTLGYKLSASGQKQYDAVLKPDLIAPGNKIVTAKATGGKLITDYPQLSYAASTSYMQISGTSVASGVVAGAAAVLIQANPGLTPGLVKAILQYTAQPIAGANVCQQGAGLLNLYAAVKLAKSLKTSVSGLNGGDQLSAVLSLPSLITAIKGESCQTSGVIFSNAYHVWAGSELFTRFQMIYKPGALWYGQTIKTNGTTITSGTVLSPGVKNVTLSLIRNYGQLGPAVLAGGYVLTTGVTISSGITFSEGIVLSEGMMLAEGTLLAEGVARMEGITFSEGMLISEGVMNANSTVSVIFGE